jgi:hypothetical protein
VAKDPSSAVVRGATVEVYSVETGVMQRRVTTNADGLYTAGLLRPGSYRVEVTDQALGSTSQLSQYGSTNWNVTTCQSRSLLQHVMPEPQPSSCGSISQGMPLQRTKRNSAEASSVWQARCATLGPTWCGRQHRLNQIPQGIGKQRAAHRLSILALGQQRVWDLWIENGVLLGVLIVAVNLPLFAGTISGQIQTGAGGRDRERHPHLPLHPARGFGWYRAPDSDFPLLLYLERRHI